jgi:hypothetical protein
MSTKPPRTDRELVARLSEAAAEDAIAGVLAETKEETARAIDADGGDSRGIAERGERLARELLARHNVVPFRPARRTPFATYSMWAAIAASILAIIGGFTAKQISDAHHKDDVPPPWDAGPQEHGGRPFAVRLRERAIPLCEQGARRDCELLLDRAKELDPEGERTDPRVQEWRAKIIELSTHPPKDEKGLPR